MSNRLLYFYLTKTRLFYLTKYNIKTIHKIPSIKKIKLSLEVKEKRKVLLSLLLLKILTSSPVSFIKKGDRQLTSFMASSDLVKSDLVFTFFDRFLSYYLYRIPFFKGIAFRLFNDFGNLIYEIEDPLVFPELEEELEFFYFLKKIKLNFVFKGSSKDSSKFIFSLYSVPLI